MVVHPTCPSKPNAPLPSSNKDNPSPKDCALTAFGKPNPIKWGGRQSLILKYSRKDSFNPL